MRRKLISFVVLIYQPTLPLLCRFCPRSTRRSAPRRRAFRALNQLNLKTSRAWCIKENFSQFWSYSYKGAAKRFFKAWSNNAMRSKLEPVKKVVKMLRRHEEGLINFSQHKISNACAEGFKSAI